MTDFVLDFGNARIKWLEPRSSAYQDARHAIVQLTEGDWRSVSGRGKPPEGILKVNGTPYAIGDAARRYLIPERPRGAERYIETYYGVGLAYSLSEAFQRDVRTVDLFASHPPSDIVYARDIANIAKNTAWVVENRYGKFTYRVRSVNTFDEPLGGYMHYVFTERGEERKRNPLATATTLVVDVGGHTVDVAAVDAGGQIDTLSLHSTRTGVIDLTSSFERDLRANNVRAFQDARDIDITRIERAILTGVFKFGKVEIDCRTEAAEAINVLVNDVVMVIRAAGGLQNFDYLLLTGGGSALISSALQEALPKAEILFAEPNPALMKYANVMGGGKLSAILRAMED